MTNINTIDYSKSNLTIQQAMIDSYKKTKHNKYRQKYIHWDKHLIYTSDEILVPHSGIIQGTFLNSNTFIEQGFDIKINGDLFLSDGTEITTLRTWKDVKYDDTVEYYFTSSDFKIYIWNVYKNKLDNEIIIEDKWSGNSGFWIEKLSESERIYHCSHGLNEHPDFNNLTFKIKILPQDAKTHLVAK